MERTINSFSKGVDQDTSVNKYDNQHYFDATNLRLVGKYPLSNGALSNLDGNVVKLKFAAGDTILGQCVIRDTVIFFAHHDAGGKIYMYTTTGTDYQDSPTLIYYSSDLVFDENSIIRAVGNYENENIQKIYFTDGSTFFKHLNIVADSYPISLTDVPVTATDLVTDITFENISTEILPTGNLYAGRIQYAYQIYNVHGSESSISPTSELLSLSASNDSLASSFGYKGSEIGTNTGKSVNVTLTIEDTTTRVRLYALEYTVLYQIPQVRIVGEYDVTDTTSITILDSGQSLGEITLEEFRFIQNEFYPSTLEIKNNYLFAANNTKEYFDIDDTDFDARVFRFNSGGTARVWEGTSYVDITSLTSVPDVDYEAYNKFNDFENDYTLQIGNNTTHQYKYQSDGVTLGGEGPNISYEFITNQIVLDDTVKTYDFTSRGYPRLTAGVSAPFTNYANPQLSAGYQRDEVYRFGIVFYDLKGRPSFTKWIGDIRFPSNRELPYIEYDSLNTRTLANILGIEFTVDISNIEDLISGYQIVRSERTNSDKTVVCQGLMGYPIHANIGEGKDDDHLYPAAMNVLVKDCVNKETSVKKQTEELDGEDLSDNDDYYTQSGIDMNSGWIEFDSPDVVINKTNLLTSNAYLEVFGYLNEEDAYGISGTTGDTRDELDSRDVIAAVKPRNFSYETDTYKLRTSISNSRLLTPKSRGTEGDPDDDATVIILEGSQIYNNQTYLPRPLSGEPDGTNAKSKWGMRGTYSLLTVEDEIPFNSDWYDDSDPYRYPITYYRIARGNAIYGGTTYEARSNSKYYPASSFVDKTTSSVEVYNGDTYISYFVYARSLYENRTRVDGYRIETFIFYPVESTINLELRLDPMQDYIGWGYYEDSKIPDYRLVESVSMGTSLYSTAYPTEVGDLYRYNSAYSCIDKSREFIPRPFDYESTLIYDNEIAVSDLKISGEYIDSWLKFRFNNVLEVNSKYGPINKLLNFKNSLLFFQDSGVGNASVNERSIIQDNNVGQLTLGTGGILARYDYLSTNSGTTFYYGADQSDNSVYYIDATRKRIYRLNNPEEPISVVKGLDSALNTYSFDNVYIGIDKSYNEVLFQIDSVVWSFNEFANAFISRYTMNPSGFFNIGSELFSYATEEEEVPWLVNDLENVLYDNDDPDTQYMLISDAGEVTTVYKHNVGEKGVFTEGQASPDDSTLTLIINPNGNQVNIYDNLDLRTISKNNSSVEQINDTFYQMDFENDYQSYSRDLSFTTSTSESTGTIKRIARVWRTPIIPNLTSGVSYYRMVDTYLKLKLYYSNSSDNNFTIHDIMTYLRPSKR